MYIYIYIYNKNLHIYVIHTVFMYAFMHFQFIQHACIRISLTGHRCAGGGTGGASAAAAVDAHAEPIRMLPGGRRTVRYVQALVSLYNLLTWIRLCTLPLSPIP